MYRKLVISLAIQTHTSIGYYYSLSIQNFLQILSDYEEIIEELKEAQDGE